MWDENAVTAEEVLQTRVQAWMDQIERDGGWEIHNAETDADKLLAVHKRIAEIERESDQFVGESRFLYLGLSDLEHLSALRYKYRNRVMGDLLPGRTSPITDTEIEYARSIRLDRIIPKLPKSRKILCPFHQEKTPSFHVGAWGYCFGCGAYTDSISWIMKNSNVSFIEAVKRLGEIG